MVEKVSYDILDASGRIISSVQLNAAEATRHEINMSWALLTVCTYEHHCWRVQHNNTHC